MIAVAALASCLRNVALCLCRHSGRHLRTEADGHAQHNRAARYFGPGRQRLERSARVKRWRRSIASRQQLHASGSTAGAGDAALLGWRRLAAPAQQARQGQQQAHGMQLPSPNFLPLRAEEDGGPPAGPAGQPLQQRFPLVSAAEELAADQAAAAQREGETNEEMLLRRTREYNLATRERPYDIQLWLEFARFQVGGVAGRRVHDGRCRTCGPRIAVLRRAARRLVGRAGSPTGQHGAGGLKHAAERKELEAVLPAPA